MRILVVASILLGAFVISTFVSLLITRSLSQKAVKKSTTKEEGSETVSITPQERSIYLDLPQSFPKDMPLIKDAKVTVANEESDQWTAVFLTTIAIEQARAFYDKELPGNGWTVTNQSQAAGLNIVYARKDIREAIVTVGRGDEGTTVSLTILKGS